MIVDKHISIWRLLGVIWKQLLSMLVLASVIVIPIVYLNLGSVLDLTAPLILGTAISIFLGFRTNSAYERWFLARSTWGSMRASSRNLALILTRLDEKYINHNTGKTSALARTIMRRMIRRNLAWLWILGRQLKGLPALQGAKELLSEDDLAIIQDCHNPALKLLFLQSRDFRIAQSEGQFYDGEHFEIVGIQRDLVAGQTSCEGLKNTPFPTHYTFFTHLFIWLFLVLLAFSLPGLENMNYIAIPAVVLVGWIFFMVEGIGSYMEEPFVNNRNVIPMDALARSLEIDLKAIALEDDIIPEMIKPIDGALY
jgi:putative membrane protein